MKSHEVKFEHRGAHSGRPRRPTTEMSSAISWHFISTY